MAVEGVARDGGPQLGLDSSASASTLGGVAKIASDVEPRAPANQVRRARDQLRRTADELGLSNLRLAKDGTLVVHVDDDPSYRQVLKFVTEASRILGAELHVVTDDAPIADHLTTTPL
jgi:hypothetical protein